MILRKTLPESSKTVRSKTGNHRAENGKSLGAERKKISHIADLFLILHLIK
ncbi:hypothetical protein HMPREF9442_02243 [Paraprevotella xylaniphila YIT 11841]|uniref:Uncharacterized protein n=1 Tax=Paraprevotella xylaniphila YIT 11841 TaxID=762982 RepID=F3QVL7_9BACT|nr:hypothetical protein HMPREF9442_02243 [Paraprevotella xylaniphila YIT 11841]